jgi:hypothetical protein
VGFRGPNGHHNNELDDRTDTHCDDRYAQGLFNVLLVNRIRFVFSEIPWVIHKSLFGGAAAKSDLARSGFVHTVGKTSSVMSKRMESRREEKKVVVKGRFLLIH